MNNEKMIKITDTQTDIESGEQDSVEVTVRGTLCGEGGDYVLNFDEIFAEGMQSHTVLTVQHGSCVSIVRSGDVITELQLELGKRHICLYSTPYGDMNIGIYAKEINSDMTAEGGTLRLEYTIDYNGALTARKQMQIEVKKND